ncbi:MAG: dUTP diphosphatase [Spirochaetota bacterium]
MLNIKIHAIPGATHPVYQTEGSAGADLYSYTSDDIAVHPGETKLIPTGISLEIPEGYEGQIRPRSGLALKHNITLLNSPGTIDSDYRGEIKILLTNLGTEPFLVTNHMRIAQLVIAPCVRAAFETASTLASSERGSGGFGHTGI